MSFKTTSEGILLELVTFIEGIFKHTAPVVTQVAEQAAVASAEQEVATDPRAQAIATSTAALLAAAQQVKAAIQTPLAEPEAS